MNRRSVVLPLLILLVTACGAGPVGSDTPISSEPVSPSTTLAATEPDCPNFVTVVETGPPPTNVTEDGPLAQAQNRLQDDASKAAEYGAQHPDEFGSLRFENSPRVRLVIGFTDHLDQHCAALRGLLEYPDEFELIQDRVTEQGLEEIQAEVSVMAGEHLKGSGSGSADGVVTVELRADSEDLAQRILDRYGDLVSIMVGALPYPDPTLAAEFNVCGAELPPPPTNPVSLDAVLTLSGSGVVSGDDFEGVVTVTNTGDEVIKFESGSPLAALVFLPGIDSVVGVYTGVIAGVGVGADLGPAQSIDIDVLGSTASCDPELGYALPPGEYRVRVPVDQYEYPGGEFEMHAILSDPAPLTVTG
jgi:hypothetical protein